MKTSLPITYNGKQIEITVRKLLYRELPAWEIYLPNGGEFILKQDGGEWVPLVDGETDIDLVRTVSHAINCAHLDGTGDFTNNDLPALPPMLF